MNYHYAEFRQHYVKKHEHDFFLENKSHFNVPLHVFKHGVSCGHVIFTEFGEFRPI